MIARQQKPVRHSSSNVHDAYDQNFFRERKGRREPPILTRRSVPQSRQHSLERGLEEVSLFPAKSTRWITGKVLAVLTRATSAKSKLAQFAQNRVDATARHEAGNETRIGRDHLGQLAVPDS